MNEWNEDDDSYGSERSIRAEFAFVTGTLVFAVGLAILAVLPHAV